MDIRQQILHFYRVEELSIREIARNKPEDSPISQKRGGEHFSMEVIANSLEKIDS